MAENRFAGSYHQPGFSSLHKLRFLALVMAALLAPVDQAAAKTCFDARGREAIQLCGQLLEATATPKTDRHAALRKRAREHFSQSDFVHAAQDLTELNRAGVATVSDLVLATRASLRANRALQASGFFRQAQFIEPQPELVVLEIGWQLSKAGRWPDVVDMVNLHIRQKGTSADLLALRGWARYKQGESGASDDYVAALAMPGLTNKLAAELHNNLGLVLKKGGDAVGALTRFETAIRFNDLHPFAHENRGYQLLYLGRNMDALAEFHIQLNRQRSANNLGNVADALIELDRLEEADTLMREALQRNDVQASSYLVAGKIRFFQGNLIDAERLFAEAEKRNGASIWARYWRANVLVQQSKFEEALVILEPLAMRATWQADVHTLHGDTLLRLNRPNDAVASYTTAQRLSPQAGVPHERLARAYGQLSLWQQSLEQAYYALEKDHGNARAHGIKAMALWWLGNQSAALASFDTALKLDGRDLEALKNRAELHEQLGQHALALADYEQMLGIAANAAAWRGKARVLRALGRSAEAEKAEADARTLPQDSDNISGAFGRLMSSWTNFGIEVQLEAKNYEAVVAAMSKEISGGRGLHWHYQTRARAYHGLKNFGAAAADYKQAAELNPDDESNIDAFADALFETEKFSDVIRGTSEHLQKHRPKSVAALRNRGWAYYRQKKYAAAKFDYDMALKYNDTRVWTVYERALVHDAMELNPEAIADYTATLAIKPESENAREYLGNILTSLGRHEEALVQYDALANLNRAAFALEYKADALLSLGRIEEADKLITEALALPDARSSTHIINGRVQRELGNYGAAEKSFETARKLDPEAHMARYWIADLRFLDGQYEESYRRYLELVPVWPDNARLQVNIGMSLYEQGKTEAAKAHFSLAAVVEPQNPEGPERRALANLRLERFADAVADSSLAISRDASYWLAYARRANAYWKLDQMAEARADYQKALTLQPASRWLLEERADFRLADGAPELALKDADAALALPGADAYTLRLRGLVAEHLKRFREASAYYSRALGAKNRRDWMLEDRAYAYVAMNKPLLALADCETYIARARKNADGYRCRARVLSGLGRLKEALADLDTAVSTDPAGAGAHYERGQLLIDRRQRLEMAEADFTKAIKAKYRVAESHYYRGTVREELGNAKQAIKDYEAALRLARGGWASAVSARLDRLRGRYSPGRDAGIFYPQASSNRRYVD